MPPGPWKLPIIGSMHHLAGALPHHALAAVAKKHGPIVHLQLGEISTVVISGARMAREVLKTHDVAFANRPKILAADIITYDYQDVAMAPYGDYWRQMRKICVLELLSAKSISASRFIREDEAWKMINSIQSSASMSQPVDLSQKTFALTNAVTCRASFGSRCKNQDQLVSLIDELMELSTGFDIVDLFPSMKFIHVISGTASRLKKLLAKLDPIFENIIQEQKEINRASATNSTSGGQAGDQDNLVAVLLKVNERGGLDVPITTDAIKAVFVDIFSGGTDTTATTVIWAMSELMRNPRILEKAQAEVRSVLGGKNRIHEEDIKGLDYLKLVIKETMRLHPPVPMLLPRECREECQINGYDIPVKTKVILNAYAVNRDPEYWQDPDVFEPERFANTGIEFLGHNFEYIPFGGGRRICPGISFGIANVQLALSQLLYHFDWKLPNGAKPESLDMAEAFGTAVKKKNSLRLVATPHVPFE